MGCSYDVQLGLSREFSPLKNVNDCVAFPEKVSIHLKPIFCFYRFSIVMDLASVSIQDQVLSDVGAEISVSTVATTTYVTCQIIPRPSLVAPTCLQPCFLFTVSF